MQRPTRPGLGDRAENEARIPPGSAEHRNGEDKVRGKVGCGNDEPQRTKRVRAADRRAKLRNDEISNRTGHDGREHDEQQLLEIRGKLAADPKLLDDAKHDQRAEVQPSGGAEVEHAAAQSSRLCQITIDISSA